MRDYTEFDGLTFLGELELDNEPWNFSLIGVWKSPDGYYLGTDSGCSCPIPWESYQRDDLTGPLNAEQARTEIVDHFRDGSSWGKTDQTEADKFLSKLVEQ